MNYVVHCKREKYDVYIGRPSKWGNPFEIGKDGDRATVIEKYREWITNGNGKYLLKYIHELQGKVLGCWCYPNACHGDVLHELSEGAKNAEQRSFEITKEQAIALYRGGEYDL